MSVREGRVQEQGTRRSRLKSRIGQDGSDGTHSNNLDRHSQERYATRVSMAWARGLEGSSPHERATAGPIDRIQWHRVFAVRARRDLGCGNLESQLERERLLQRQTATWVRQSERRLAWPGFVSA